MGPYELTAASLDRMEQQLLADLEVVRQMKEVLGRRPLPAVTGAASPASPPVVAAPGPVIAAARAPAQLPPPEAPAPYVPPPRHPNFAVTDVRVAVRQIIDTLSGTFGIGDVKSQLQKQHYQTFGDSTIRAVLQGMQEKGELVLTARGIGRAGNKYSKPAPAPAPDSQAVLRFASPIQPSGKAIQAPSRIISPSSKAIPALHRFILPFSRFILP